MSLAPSRPTPRPAPATAPFARTAAVLSFTALLATGQLYGVIPLFAAMEDDWGAGRTTLTWMVSVFGFGYVAGFLLFGPLSDRFGRRRVVVWGVAATTLTTALVATAPSLGSGLALRALQGLTIGAFPPVAMAYVGERVEPRRRLVTLTAMTTGFLSAAVLGQLAAQGLAATVGWRAFFLFGAVAFAVAAVALHRVMLPDPPVGGRSPLDAYRAMPALLVSPRLRRLYLATLTVLGSFVAVFTGLELSGVDGLLGLRAAALPVILAIPFLTPRLARLPGPHRVGAALALAAGAVALAGLLEPGTAVLAVLLIALTGGIAIAAPGLVDTVGTRAGDARGPAISLFTAVLFLGASIGPQIAGPLTSHGFAPLAYVLAGLLLSGSLLAASTASAARR
ncbi:MFS transporter [Thermomonospora umbrina]|uniref:Putative MFS family arabinose efflux permease n=1 Tax=Thermomonospora umbrina TaxID=111806 RepID=A0A3D9SYD6_9ACTN|nr:MFS transporter [Thermomonospora umbrina]REE99530.1 putative MFS family arabinose efflux permease [Thermomonospora umbrina]